MSFLVVPVTYVARVTPTAAVVRVGIPGGGFSFAPGQAVILGRHGQPAGKPYSIASAPEDVRRTGEMEFLVGVGEHGQFDEHLAGTAPAALLDLDGPFGSFLLPPGSHPGRFVFVAGGTGIAPLRAMWRHLGGARPDAPLDVVYSARTRAHFAYEDELRRLAADGHITLALTTTREPIQSGAEGHRDTGAEGTVGGRLTGRVGREHLEGLVARGPAVWLLCGPPAFVAHVERLLGELGVPSLLIRKEDW